MLKASERAEALEGEEGHLCFTLFRMILLSLPLVAVVVLVQETVFEKMDCLV